jgi:hypothetical protein
LLWIGIFIGLPRIWSENWQRSKAISTPCECIKGAGRRHAEQEVESPVGMDADLADYRGRAYCHGLVQLPIAA